MRFTHNERLELLGAMDPMTCPRRWPGLPDTVPAVFGAAIVRDRGLAERLINRLAEDEDNGPDKEPYCDQRDATIGSFLSHGGSWQHFRGEGPVECPERAVHRRSRC